MNLKKIIVSIALIISESFSFCQALSFDTKAEETVHTVTIIDFDGNVMETLNVSDGDTIDLSQIDTSSLEKHLDIYTQIGFNSWSLVPESIIEDITIYALYRKMTIALESTPQKTEYYDNFGDISLDGLKVTITTEIQTVNENNEIVTQEDVIDISSSCVTSPATLENAFGENDYASIEVFPIGSDKPIAVYDIKYYKHLGDANMDGKIDATDASLVLQMYSDYSTGKTVSFQPSQKKMCDVDGDGKVTSVDAAFILSYYSEAATSEHPSWEKVLN